MRRGILVALMAAAVWPRTGYADDQRHGDLPLGGRAVGLGGAFTALADDPSGLYYNPAGIVDVERGSIQVSTNFYGIEVPGGLGDAFGAVVDVERVASNLNLLPATAAGLDVRSRDASGRPVTVIGVGTFVPSSGTEERSVIDALDESERFAGCAQLAYERSLSDQRFLAGGGVGHRVDDRWSIGASAFVQYRSLRDREEIVCSDPNGGRDGPAFSTADTRVNLDVFTVRLSFGVLARFDEGWRFGATLTPPSIHAFGRGGVRVRQSRALPMSGRTAFVLRDLANLRAETQDGLSLRLGAAKTWSDLNATLSADIIAYGPSRYELVRFPNSERGLAELVTLLTEVERVPVVDVAFGGEILPDPGWVVGAGVFTRFSSAPGIPEAAGFAEDRLADVDEFGFTLLGGWFTDNNITRLGLALTYRGGQDVVPRFSGLAAVGGRNRYVLADVEAAAIWVFVSNTTRYGSTPLASR